MAACIFVGPSLARVPPEVTLGLEIRGPARQGDVYRAARSGFSVIGLIDGYFETVPSVWHKEILWALSQGIHVYGASSVGALRAAELEPFGMRGVGKVFKLFSDGILLDDDEVALLHAPAGAGYMPLTEAMVNVRATLASARSQGVLSEEVAETLIPIAKGIFYKVRTYDNLISSAVAAGVAGLVPARFLGWLRLSRIDQKKLDALYLVKEIQAHFAHGVEPFAPQFHMHRTAAWEDARTTMERK